MAVKPKTADEKALRDYAMTFPEAHESYRAVAPKKLVKLLDGEPTAAPAKAKKARRSA